MISRWRGLVRLVCDGVDQGSRAVEILQRAQVARTVAVLAKISVLAAPASVVETAHELVLTGSHASLRAVNQGLLRVAELLLTD